MLDGINSNKEWVNVDKTTKDKEYQSELDKKITSILNGQQTVSADKLRKNSLFSNISAKAEERFNDIARMDGDGSSFSADELKVLFSLADAKLENNQFKFDMNFEVDKNSALEQANNREVNAMIKNLVQNDDVAKRIETVDTSKYNRTKAFKNKIKSDDVDEVMLAVQDKLSVGINKSTGKSISVTQAVLLFQKCLRDASYDRESAYKLFKDVTGIEASDYDQCRCPGDNLSLKIGDWSYDKGTITNNKTGEVLHVKNTNWVNSTTHTIPAANGKLIYIESYSDGQGTNITFNYGDDENIAPTSANITVDGKNSTVNYNPKYRVDPDLYNFKER